MSQAVGEIEHDYDADADADADADEYVDVDLDEYVDVDVGKSSPCPLAKCSGSLHSHESASESSPLLSRQPWASSSPPGSSSSTQPFPPLPAALQQAAR